MTTKQVHNKTFEEIQVGESAQMQRTLTEEDIKLFAATSGDLNPTHFDESYAKARDFQGIVGHSMWGPLLVSNLLGNVLPGPGTVYRLQEIRFQRPLLLGDTLTVSITAREKNKERQSVIFECGGLNQRHETVFGGSAEVLPPDENTVTVRQSMPGVTIHDHDAYAALLKRCSNCEPVLTAVAHPCESTALRGALNAAEAGLITPILVGPKEKIQDVAASADLDLQPFQIEDVPHSHAAASRAVELIRTGDAEILMKGSLHTDEIMKAVISSKTGLRTERRISHAFIMSVPTYHKPLIVTDAAINIAPDLDGKRDICQNAIDLARVLGISQPRVAILAAVESVSSSMPATLDAAALCKMAERGQIAGGLLDGPLAMDNAISVEAARTKGIESEVAGEADILLAPDLEAGNILAKQLTFLANADAAGIVLGARVPIILTSRAAKLRTRTASCAVAVLLAHARRGDRKRG
ncbi:MAG: bifunctional enoyl-CoA hydratase/phosphate acetyltransferase [Planctomycetota bacterium]|jgi:phosphotransacetylase/acyl dehydratase